MGHLDRAARDCKATLNNSFPLGKLTIVAVSMLSSIEEKSPPGATDVDVVVVCDDSQGVSQVRMQAPSSMHQVYPDPVGHP